MTESSETGVLKFSISIGLLSRSHGRQDRDYAGSRFETRRKLDRILLLFTFLSEALTQEAHKGHAQGFTFMWKRRLVWLVVDLVDIRVDCSVKVE